MVKWLSFRSDTATLEGSIPPTSTNLNKEKIMKKQLFGELKESLEEVLEMAKKDKNNCKACGYKGKIDMWGCPKCKGMGNYFWMEDVQSLAVEVDSIIEKKLKEFEITLTNKQEDQIHNNIWKVLEDVSNGYYRHHN